MALIPGLKSSFDTISMAEQMVRISNLAAGPSFELSFSIAQNTVLDRLDKEIAELQEQKVSTGATALLEVNISRLKNDAGEINAFAARAKSNRITTQDIITDLSSLVGLADSSTVAEFDAQLAATIARIEKLETPLFELYGAPDGLRKVKADALAQLNGLVHNNFATTGDVTSVQSTLNSLSADFGGALVITTINADAGFNLSQDTNAKIADIDAEITAITLGEQATKIDDIEEQKKRAAQILTALSLSFEASQALTDYITQATIFKPEIDPGSILNIFS